MKNILAKMREAFFTLKLNFFESKAGEIFLTLIAVLGKFFRTKKGKYILAAASFVSYLFFFSWQFSIIVMIMIYVHELGHIWAMKRRGIVADGIYFIPFFGAIVSAKTNNISHKDMVFVAIMGPIGGFMVSFVLVAGYFVLDSPFCASAAGIVALFNLFNLFPIYPLDGGNIVKSLVESIREKFADIFVDLSTYFFIIVSIVFFYFGSYVSALFFGALGVFILASDKKKHNVLKLSYKGIFVSVVCYLAAMVIMFVFAGWAFSLPGASQIEMNNIMYGTKY